jgi:parallel beta-helix repeat protein
MNQKEVSGILLALLLISMLASNIAGSLSSQNQPAECTIVLDQNFDDETTGDVPENWNITALEYGNIAVNETVYHGASGKSARFLDNSTEGSPSPYRNFTAQTGTIVVMFVITLTNKTHLEVFVDDGDFAGANIIFNENGIQYRDHLGNLIRLRDSHFPNRWYRIKMIMNIPDNVYNIHIDDHLEAINAKFTGICDQINRIIINEASPLSTPVGYIDDIEVRRCIEIPEDFPTIQEGIDAASPGDIVFVAEERIYFENVIIEKKNVWLIGEDKYTTVIDGAFIKTKDRESNGISVIECSNVTIYGFTIRNAEADGVYMDGSNNTITNNIVMSSLGCGILIVTGEDNLVERNVMRDNGAGLKCDAGTEDNIIYQNRFVCNDIQALDYGSNIWDDGYPYEPDDEKGGGNYWSDHFSVDKCSGVNQDEHGPCCSPLPDGICDTPYIIHDECAHVIQDNYPLFLIQSVSQTPDPSRIYETTRVRVDATMLEDVQVEEAKIDVVFDSTYDEIRMTSPLDVWTGSIPAKPPCTMVQYNVSARAYCAAWLKVCTMHPCTNYTYQVQDIIPAVMCLRLGSEAPSPGNCSDPCWIDFGVMSKGKTKIYDEEFEGKYLKICNIAPRRGESLVWEINLVRGNSWFTIEDEDGRMRGITEVDECTPLKITVNTRGLDPSLYVAELLVNANGIVSSWTVIVTVTVRHIVIDNSWASLEAACKPNRCDIKSIQHYAFHVVWAHNCLGATSGEIKISNVGWKEVDETGWANFTYTSTKVGKKTFEVETVKFPYTYNDEVYDITSFTQKAPSISTIWDRVNITLDITDNRIDIRSKADVSWHASTYEYDGSPFEGYPRLNDTLYHDTVGKWCITTSSIIDTKYNLGAFRSNTVCCVWDRIKIIGGEVSQPQTNVGQTETVWFIGIYEYDNKLFKGTMSKLFLNVSENMHLILVNDPMNWSSEKDVWEKAYLFNTPSTRTFKISGVNDTLYNLTEIEDCVGPLNITWGPPPWTLSTLCLWVATIIIVSIGAMAIFFWILKRRSAHTKLSMDRGKEDKGNNENTDTTPLFTVKKDNFDLYRFGKKDVELKTVEPQRKDSKVGDVATVRCERDIFRKRITNVHRGSLARIFMDLDYKRIFPEALTVFEAVKATKELYPDAEEFMAFELEDVH